MEAEEIKSLAPLHQVHDAGLGQLRLQAERVAEQRREPHQGSFGLRSGSGTSRPGHRSTGPAPLLSHCPPKPGLAGPSRHCRAERKQPRPVECQ